MRNLLVVVGIVAGTIVACGESDRPKVADGGPLMPRAGTTGLNEGGANGEGGAGPGDVGPVVEITSPEEVTDPAAGVLSESTLEVLCTVQERDGIGFDETSVKLTLHDGEGALLEELQATATDNDNEYGGVLVLETVPSGAVAVGCSAADENGVVGSDEIGHFVDQGPLITVISPEPDSAHALKGGFTIEFTVEPAELIEDDAGAALSEVSLTLDGKPIELDEVASGHYQTTIFLDDTEQFPELPAGAISISATNSREPTAVTATESYNVLIDGVGPVIVIESPPPLSVLGGEVTLVFTVSDPESGVDPETVNVTLAQGDTPRFYNPEAGWSRNGNQYRLSFDTKAIEHIAPVQATINIRASDLVQNTSATGQSLTIYLDNVPPQVDLDPLPIRMLVDSQCTGAFDPVGSAAVSDLGGQLGAPGVTRIDFFRLFIWERTNSIPGQTFFYYSGTRQNEVRLYAQAAPETAPIKLLVNKNPETDDTCDDIGGIEDLATAPTFTALEPLNPSGGHWFRNDPNSVPVSACPLVEVDGEAPDTLCAGNSDMWYVPRHDGADSEALVYAFNPGAGSACTGIDWAFIGEQATEGWVCLAGRAQDEAGNIGISPPLRVCVDDPTTPFQPACRISSTVPPTCTDGCTPPARGGGFIIDED